MPFDRRVWQEARALRGGCKGARDLPTGKGFADGYEFLEGVHIYRHPLPLEARSAAGYLANMAPRCSTRRALAWKVFFRHGFDVIHACNPPDLIFLVRCRSSCWAAASSSTTTTSTPNSMRPSSAGAACSGGCCCLIERLTFLIADVSIATNESYREIAIGRGGMEPDKVFVVRSGPTWPDQARAAQSRAQERPPLSGRLCRRDGRAGGHRSAAAIRRTICATIWAARTCSSAGRRRSQPRSLKALSREMGLDGLCHLHRPGPDAELFEVLSTADVCVNPDRVNPMND